MRAVSSHGAVLAELVALDFEHSVCRFPVPSATLGRVSKERKAFGSWLHREMDKHKSTVGVSNYIPAVEAARRRRLSSNNVPLFVTPSVPHVHRGIFKLPCSCSHMDITVNHMGVPCLLYRLPHVFVLVEGSIYVTSMAYERVVGDNLIGNRKGIRKKPHEFVNRGCSPATQAFSKEVSPL